METPRVYPRQPQGVGVVETCSQSFLYSAWKPWKYLQYRDSGPGVPEVSALGGRPPNVANPFTRFFRMTCGDSLVPFPRLQGSRHCWDAADGAGLSSPSNLQTCCRSSESGVSNPRGDKERWLFWYKVLCMAFLTHKRWDPGANLQLNHQLTGCGSPSREPVEKAQVAEFAACPCRKRT